MQDAEDNEDLRQQGVGEREFSEEQGAFIKGPCREMLTTVMIFERLHLIDIAHDDRRHGTLTELLLSYTFQYAFVTKFCDTKSTASPSTQSSTMSQLR